MQNYFPTSYQPYTYPQQYQAQQYQAQQYQPQYPQSNPGINWIDGIAAAKAYPVANGTSILLMDSNENSFYIKSADQSGMPSVKVFDYTERGTQEVKIENKVSEETPSIDLSQYATKEELSAIKTEIEKKLDAISSKAAQSRKQQ